VSQAGVYHHELRSAIQARARAQQRGNAYAGTTKLCYVLNAPATHQIAKDWTRRHPDLTAREYRQLLDSLARAESANEFGLIGELLRFRAYPKTAIR
jgi:hypothetical protein